MISFPFCFGKNFHGLSTLDNTKRTIFIGNIQACESRLALAALHVKHVVTVSSFPIENKWTDDGICYTHHLISSLGGNKPPQESRAIVNVTKNISSIVESNKNGSILVACATGEDFSISACTLFIMQRFELNTSEALDKIVSNVFGNYHEDKDVFISHWLYTFIL